MSKLEEQAVKMLCLCNINQLWNCFIVEYFEDAYTMGDDIYPTLLPDAYHFLMTWKCSIAFVDGLPQEQKGSPLHQRMVSKRMESGKLVI